MRAVRYLVEQAHVEDVKYFFGMQGGGISPLFNELYDYPYIKTILSRHEQGASFEATGYAMVTGKAQMVGGTVGPGAVNIISGLHPAYQNSIPVLAVVSNAPSLDFGRMSIQDASGWGPRTISHVGMAEPVTKWTKTIFRPELVPEAVRRAFRIMYSGRPGPVLLDMCFDVFMPEVDAEILSPSAYRPVCTVRGDVGKIHEAAEILVEAQSPTILAGGGVVGAGAFRELLELSELLSIPVATTLMGKSAFPEDHPLALGCAGFFGHDPANLTLKKAKTDVLLAIGTVFHMYTTWTWATDFGGDKLIQVDIDPTEIGKNYPVSVGIVGDARLVLTDLIEHVKRLLTQMNPSKRKALEDLRRDRTREILKLKGDAKYYEEDQMSSQSTPTKPQRALKELREFLDRDAIVLTDAGNNLTWTERYLRTYLPGTFFVDGGCTSMGASLALAIGAKLGAPSRQVVDVIGNAAFVMLCKEVVTASTYTIPVVWFILNDRTLGAIAHYVSKFGYGGLWEPGRYASTGPELYDMDFVKFAEACHVFGQRVEKPTEIKDALRNAFNSGKPAVIDVDIDPDELHPGTIQRFKRTIDTHPDLLTQKMPRKKYPERILESR
jgi:acetolactate synthase-1/2/3 large subunit